MKELECEPRENLSSSKSVGFRPGTQLRNDLEQLAREMSLPGATFTISDILRNGVTAFWPQIRAHIRGQTRSGGLDPDAIDKIMAAALRSHQLGLTPEEIENVLEQALSSKLSVS